MIRSLLYLYCILLVLDALLSFFPQFRSQKWAQQIKQIADFTTGPVRKFLPHDLPFDFSHLLVIVAIQIFIKMF